MKARWALGLFAVVAALLLAACEGPPTKVNGSKSSRHAGSPFKIGDKIALGGADLTVRSVTDPYVPNPGTTGPKPGTRFIGVDARLWNTSPWCIGLTDAVGHRYDAVQWDGRGNGLSTRWARMTLVYEVPVAAHINQLTFGCFVQEKHVAKIKI